MITLKSVGVCSREKPSPRLYPLSEALTLAGVTAPTFYRWIRAGKIEDCRIRGQRGKVHLSAPALLKLRQLATHVEYVGSMAEEPSRGVAPPVAEPRIARRTGEIAPSGKRAQVHGP